ncbi:MAG: hypothetical protein Q9227_001474 [Pyrenula ochraceoflavens]
MKFLPHPNLDVVSAALNFDTADLHVVGSCDVYTTKAAGADKKLYKTIDHDLAAQYDSALKFSNSLPTPQASLAAESFSILSRSSPFGPLSQISSRRTFAYLVATLNASHPDYDFSTVLRPKDFKREKSLRDVINNIDTTVYNLRPQTNTHFLSVPGYTAPSAGGPFGHAWGPKTWRLLDEQMSLKECSVYQFAPSEDPFEDSEESAVWSLHYFFFNRLRKRVCYLYVRGISILSHSPSAPTPVTPRHKRFFDEETEGLMTPEGEGARKRARYWLGDRDDIQVVEDEEEEEEEEEVVEIPNPSKGKTKENARPQFFESESPELRPLPRKRPLVDEQDNFILSDEDAQSTRSISRGPMRGISEEIKDSMDV